jgi:rhamnose transport system ATP-binding protein
MNHPTEFANVGFTLRRGEILGFYGLIGAGRSELMLALMGLNPGSRGSVHLDGQRVTIREPADAMAAGIAYVPEERQRQGGILAFPVQHNISLAGLSRFANGPWLSPRREAALYADMTQRLRIKAESGEMPLSGLSGGNQQKVVIAKWLCLAPRIVILDEPTKGIDVGAKQAVYQLIAELVAEGLAVILVSSELPEVMNLTHRAVVMRRGRVVAELDRADYDAEHFVAAASGLAWPPAPRGETTDALQEAA